MSEITYTKEEIVIVDVAVTKIRDAAVSSSKEISGITTEPESWKVGNMLTVLKTYVEWIEGLRTNLKSPYLEAGKKIDAACKDLTQEAVQELNRLKKIAGEYIAQQEKLQLQEIRENGVIESDSKIADGIYSTDEWDFEVEDTLKAFAFNQELFEITPRRGAIKKLLKDGIAIPGIKGFTVKSVRVKSDD